MYNHEEPILEGEAWELAKRAAIKTCYRLLRSGWSVADEGEVKEIIEKFAFHPSSLPDTGNIFATGSKIARRKQVIYNSIKAHADPEIVYPHVTCAEDVRLLRTHSTRSILYSGIGWRVEICKGETIREQQDGLTVWKIYSRSGLLCARFLCGAQIPFWEELQGCKTYAAENHLTSK